jgi:osmotically-inducible protein OsmY
MAAGAAGATAYGAHTANANANTALTAQDTGKTQNETETIRKIRSEIVNDSALSMQAHNVKIINQEGQIYLKGPVENASEKSKVEEIAKRTAGNMNVVNQTYVETK